FAPLIREETEVEQSNEMRSTFIEYDFMCQEKNINFLDLAI
ncbi:MAG: hypothetical protein H6Q48_4788, partial [Deltaproteobacteria bacterium]|nr:hypothetical protein [Deltaproteobacteria bacterium]